MTDALAITIALSRVRDELLAEMKEEGFNFRGQRRHDALVWDINNGFCETFGERAVAALPDEIRDRAYCGWLDEITGDPESPLHYVIVIESRFYDAECIEGVDDVTLLPIYRLPGRPSGT